MNKFIISFSFIFVISVHLLILNFLKTNKIEHPTQQTLNSSVLIQLSRIENKNEVIKEEVIVKDEVKKPLNEAKNIKQTSKNTPIKKESSQLISNEEFVEKKETEKVSEIKIEENENTQEQNLKENTYIKNYITELREEINKNKSYPSISKRLKEQGKVIISFRVLKNGLFVNINILKSSNYQRLDNAALDALSITKQFREFDKEINKEYLDFELPLEFITIN